MSIWYLNENRDMDIALSSRVRLARNLSDIPFSSKMNDEDRENVVKQVEVALKRGEFTEKMAISKIDISSLSPFEMIRLVEEHIVSVDFISDTKGKALFLSLDKSISIMINEEDHIRIQVLSSGNNVKKCYIMASKIDDLLDSHLKYAFDSNLGFLTHCPTNLGTGMRASVMLHLPMLERKSYLNSITQNLTKMGQTIRGTYGEGTSAIGSYYQISNQITLGITEETAIDNLNHIINEIIITERHQREGYENDITVKDNIFRTFGILNYARKMTNDELTKMTSYLRLGVYYKYFKEIKYTDVNEIMFSLGSSEVDDKTSKDDIEKKRAGQVREKLRSLKKETDVDINV